MYEGMITEELQRLIEEYTSIFGYGPDEEITIDYGKDYKDYMKDIMECIARNIEIAALNNNVSGSNRHWGKGEK